MKIGIDVSSAIYGTGVSNYLIDLVAHLPSDQIVLFGFSLRRREDLKRILLKGVSFPIPPTLMDFLWNRLHILNVENFTGPIDVYHSSDWTQGPSKAKKVTTIHDLSPFLYPQEVDPKIVAVHTRRMKWAVAECDHFICVSQNTASDLQRLFAVPSSKITVIYEALPSKYLSLKPQITRNTNYVFAIGARQPRKNIQRLIGACQLLKQKLIVVGEKPSNQVTNNQVTYTGYVSDQDLVNYLSQASVFVYPSLYEGFGLPILEAFHYQVPVAASNISSIPEVAGDAAVLFDPYSEESIASAITQAIKNRDKLVASGTKQLAKFSWDQTAQQTLIVYNSLL